MTDPAFLPQILILAAGASSRMGGRDKLLEEVEGQPLVARSARMALATGLRVTIALPPDRPARQAVLAGLPLRIVLADRAQEGMAESLKAGIAALPALAPVLLVLADLPELQTADLSAVLEAGEAAPELIHRGASDTGQPGHPVLLPAWLRPEILDLTGDQGARELLQCHRDKVRLVPLPGARAITDLDTPEDWAAWRAAQADISTRAS